MTKAQFYGRNDMKMMKKGLLLGVTAVTFFLPWQIEGAEITQNSVLDGVAVYVIAEQNSVKAGDVLLSVESLVGDMPAARADSDGVVKKVFVKKGMKVKAGDPVAVVEV